MVTFTIKIQKNASHVKSLVVWCAKHKLNVQCATRVISGTISAFQNTHFATGVKLDALLVASIIVIPVTMDTILPIILALNAISNACNVLDSRTSVLYVLWVILSLIIVGSV